MAETNLLARLDERIQGLQLDVGALVAKIDGQFHSLIDVTTRVTKLEAQVGRQEHFISKIFDYLFKLAVIASATFLGLKQF